MTDAPPRLNDLQRWMQAVVIHPDGVEAGIESPAARGQIDISPQRAGEVISRSHNQTSIQRLQVYANAYYARLLECLRDEFPALVHTLGEETFNGFAFAYLQAQPSRSYTLSQLGRSFPQFLADTRPDHADGRGSPSWPDLLVDLATVERTYSEVFDGPGLEGRRILRPEDVAAISPDRWPHMRLAPAACLRLLTLAYPVHEYISAVRHGKEAVLPNPSPTYLVVTRRDYVVRRIAVSQQEYELLSLLVSGATVGRAIERFAENTDVDDETLATNVRDWFQRWTEIDLFEPIDFAGD